MSSCKRGWRPYAASPQPYCRRRPSKRSMFETGTSSGRSSTTFRSARSSLVSPLTHAAHIHVQHFPGASMAHAGFATVRQCIIVSQNGGCRWSMMLTTVCYLLLVVLLKPLASDQGCNSCCKAWCMAMQLSHFYCMLQSPSGKPRYTLYTTPKRRQVSFLFLQSPFSSLSHT